MTPPDARWRRRIGNARRENSLKAGAGFLDLKVPGSAVPLMFVAMVASLPGKAAEWQPLWNNRDFSGWERCLGKPHPSVVLPPRTDGQPRPANEPLGRENDPLRVFSVVLQDGEPAIRISGQVFGSIATQRKYSNYHLRLQIKWGPLKWPPRDRREWRDSGLLYHAHTPMNQSGRLWPLSLEFQIMEQNLGDFYAVGARSYARAGREPGTDARPLFHYNPSANLVAFARGAPAGGRCIRGPVVEHPFGKWNTLELVCLGADAVHVVNGRVVLRLQDATRIDRDAPSPLTAGRIHILSEGAELFVRRIELRPITAVPDHFPPP
jgi:hypothetical protein